jgi:nucleotide-binding universal stress UspA family protein
MKILLGVDASPHSRVTVAALCGMQWPRGTSVIVLSAVEPTEPQYAPEPHMVASVAGALAVLEADQIKTHEEVVARTEQTLREAGFETVGRVANGDPRHVLVDAARSEGADLLVVGSHGRSGIGRLLMGSVAAHVVAHAPCNVLVVKKE